MTKRLLLTILCVLTGFSFKAYAKEEPADEAVTDTVAVKKDYPAKREFRGAWMHTVSNNYYCTLTPEQWRDTIAKQLDEYAAAGINAIIFQVRPEADAFYISEIEPWSRYLTGEQGKAPDPLFDPLEFMVDECHKRGMELHAWLNPYRANVNRTTNKLTDDHLYYSKRYLFINYGNQTFFDPGQPENREFICKVVKDIVSRYDIDAIHMDDYFYPYPLRGLQFRDDKSYKKYGKNEAGEQLSRNDWRRDNVNRLIKELSQTIRSVKPWVRFGISPFGIYRNKAQFDGGSETNGLSNYDDLYADILLWMNGGWIDYCVPQLYWEIGHRLADYDVLAKWWAAADSTPVHLYIGQDVQRTFAQLEPKMKLARELEQVDGNCFWSGAALLTNPGGMLDSLKANYHHTPALLPLYSYKEGILPPPPFALSLNMMADQPTLSWQFVEQGDGGNRLMYYVVYAFDKDEEADLENPEKIIAITREKQLEIPLEIRPLCSKFYVTAVNRLHVESLPAELD